MSSSTTDAACAAVRQTTEKRATENNAPPVFHLFQFRGSALEFEGMGSLSVLPSFVMRKVLPMRLYDSRLERLAVSAVIGLEW
jgi:hypothetical protein